MLRIHIGHGRHPGLLRTFFPLDEPDPFYDEAVLNVFYGDAWVSILIEDGQAALRHTFAASAIGNTSHHDIEPLVGYAGPIVTPGASSKFLVEALDCYSSLCRQSGIVAELVRFNPLLENDRAFYNTTPNFVIRPQKPVAFIRVVPRGDSQVAGYSTTARNKVRLSQRTVSVNAVQKTPLVWDRFTELLGGTLTAAGAGSEWWFSPQVLERLRLDPTFVLVAAMRKERMVSAGLALIHRPTSYYFLAASERDPNLRRYASNGIVHEMTRLAAAYGASWLGLGGGNSPDPADSLFRFKRSFGGEIRNFVVGFLTHHPAAFQALVREAQSGEPAVHTAPLFLRYRLATIFAGGRMQPSQPLARERTAAIGQLRIRTRAEASGDDYA